MTKTKTKTKIKKNVMTNAGRDYHHTVAYTKVKPKPKRIINRVSIPPKPHFQRASITRGKKTWASLRKEHLLEQPSCQACGATTKLEVHHIVPVHIDPSQELDPNNLITLCENPNTGFCHYIFGHLAISWFKWDPYIVNRATTHLAAVHFAMTQEDAKGKALEATAPDKLDLSWTV